jgi:hypothetical protein
VSPADQTAEAELAPPPPGGRGGALDPELVVLAPPPQTQRMAALTVMAAAVVALMALAFSLVGDMAYALHAEQPRDLGSATTLDPKSLASNTFVRMSGVPTVARAVQFRQGFGTVHRVFAPAGQHTVYVRVQERGGESFVRSEFTGRLVTFGELGPRYAELAKVMQQQHMPVSSETYLLLADDRPRDYRWSWAIGLLCLAFVGLDAYFIVRWFRPLRWAAVGPTPRSDEAARR